MIFKAKYFRVWLLPALFLFLPVESRGAGDKHPAPDTIRIGLLVQDSQSHAAERGASLAVEMAKGKGKGSDLPVSLIVRSMEGPWGTGSKQAVNLVFDKNVVALLGSHDGRNAHLVEQVAAKSRVINVSAWSPDPTLAQAFVPWFFNPVFDDARQAEALADQLYRLHQFKKTAVIHDDSYEAKSSLKYLLREFEKKGLTIPFDLELTIENKDKQSIIGKLNAYSPDCIIMLLEPGTTARILEMLRINPTLIPVYCSQTQLNEDLVPASGLKNLENVRFVVNSDLSSAEAKVFINAFRKKYGYEPGQVAAAAWDGMSLILNTVRTSGTERENMQNALLEVRFQGATGSISFDQRGNRLGTPGFVIVKNGILVPLK
jgi:branched-chain amino acid transport system substrate-binding protein